MSSYLFRQTVRLKGLSNRFAPFNGKLGHIVPFPTSELCSNGRYRVSLADSVAPSLTTELDEKPENMELVCTYCHQGGENFMLCAGCRTARYCDKECQRSDWGRHKKECRSCGHARDASKNPLYLAAEAGNVRLVRKLVQEGMDVNMTTKTTGGSALFVAALKGNLPIVQCLLQHGADKNKADSKGQTPLSAAADKGHLAVVQYLLEQGADVENVDLANGPLFAAARSGRLDLLQCLLKHGADKDKANNNGCTPLIVAAAKGHLAVVQSLLEHGADKDKVDKNGLSPLWMAAGGDHLRVVQCLLEHGADNEKANKDGATPVHIAAKQGRADYQSFSV